MEGDDDIEKWLPHLGGRNRKRASHEWDNESGQRNQTRTRPGYALIGAGDVAGQPRGSGRKSDSAGSRSMRASGSINGVPDKSERK